MGLLQFEMNQDALEDIKDEIVVFLVDKYSMSEEAASELITLLYIDTIDGTTILLEEIPPLKELEVMGLGKFSEGGEPKGIEEATNETT